MVIIYRCDRCKKDKGKMELSKLVVFSTFGEHRGETRKGYHLCSECKALVNQVLDQGLKN